MIPQTFGTLVAFLALIAPGLAFELTRERKRPARSDSVFREASRIALASLILSAAAVVIQLALWKIWPQGSINLDKWTKLGNVYLQDNTTKIVGNLAAITLFSCFLGFATAQIVAFKTGEESVNINSSAWREALRSDRPRNAKVWVHVHLKDKTAFFGYLGSYSLAEKPDEREILLKGVTLHRVNFTESGEVEKVATIGEKWECVIIPSSQISYIRVQYRDLNGQPLHSNERTQELSGKSADVNAKDDGDPRLPTSAPEDGSS
ncbi:DUF6338 family protein [Amycolatopsis sp. lyj-112]|uniref:DUF6338 family protein n=1 Tax=Amycolatopsis sp. lyj-112 TaxID=2789288 RepID=UPI00397B2C53